MSVKDEKDQQHKEFASKISDEINCSICLDILVNPLTLVPCGHSFCASCCFSESVKYGKRRRALCFDKCPHCRQSIKETAPSRQLESLIDTLVTVPNLLFSNEDDKKQYLTRKKEENERSRVLKSPSRAKKRRRPDVREHVPYIPLARHRVVSGPSTNRYDHFPHGGNPYVIASARSSNRRRQNQNHHPDPFDHMAAPLPPPFDYDAMRASNANFGDQFEPPTQAPSTQTRASMTARTNTRGVSASDPICID